MDETPETLGGGSPLARFSALALARLAEAREEVDALNVYPVPDGDTGTNLYLTCEAAHAALQEAGPEASTGALVAAYCRGMLLGARGNSGVIASQLVTALLRHVSGAATGSGVGSARTLADGMVAAAEAAYAAVGEPVEGTMLTVARAAAEAAAASATGPGATPGEVVGAALEAARAALARTPDQLPVLRQAGVVDAGGRGLCLLLEAALGALTGAATVEGGRRSRRRSPAPMPLAVPAEDLTAEGPAYEVTFLLDAPDDAVPPLRRRLAGLGDSLAVVGGEGLWSVHVHVDDVGAAVEAGIAAGRPHRVRVTHFAEQLERVRRRAAEESDRWAQPRHGRAVVALAVGPGLAALFGEAGAVVLRSGLTRRPSTDDVLAAVRAAKAPEVVVLPNDPDAVATAEVAAGLAQREDGLHVAVIPTVAQVQGIAALAVHDPARPLEQDLVEMAAAARHARSGAVTVASRRAITSAGECRPGDVLGAVEGDFVVVGRDLEEVAVSVVDRMLGGGGELFTVIAGAGGGWLADRCVHHLASFHPLVEVVRHDGGQERYPVLFGVE